MGTPSTGFPINSFTVDNSKRYQIVPQTYCRRIEIQENYNSANPPTQDYLIAQPPGATQVNFAKGVPAIFTTGGSFVPGTPIADIQTTAGTITVRQIESHSI